MCISIGRKTASGQKPIAPIKATTSLKNGSSIATTAAKSDWVDIFIQHGNNIHAAITVTETKHCCLPQ